MSLQPLFDRFDESFDVVDKLGSGSFATTYVIRLKSAPLTNPTLYSLKLFRPRVPFSDIHREADVVSGLRLRNVVTYYGVYRFASQSPIFPPNPIHVGLCLEYIDGITMRELRERSDIFHPETEIIVLMMFRQLIAGLAQLHEAGIAHRDIKTDNVIVRSDSLFSLKGDQVVIIDLGFACTTKYKRIELMCRGIKGTPYYMSPELLELQSVKPKDSVSIDMLMKADIWAAGVALFEFIHQTYPYLSDDDTMETLRYKVFEDIRTNVDFGPYQRCAYLIDLCLKPEKERPSASELLRIIDTYFKLI